MLLPTPSHSHASFLQRAPRLPDSGTPAATCNKQIQVTLLTRRSKIAALSEAHNTSRAKEAPLDLKGNLAHASINKSRALQGSQHSRHRGCPQLSPGTPGPSPAPSAATAPQAPTRPPVAPVPQTPRAPSNGCSGLRTPTATQHTKIIQVLHAHLPSKTRRTSEAHNTSRATTDTLTITHPTGRHPQMLPGLHSPLILAHGGQSQTSPIDVSSEDRNG